MGFLCWVVTLNRACYEMVNEDRTHLINVDTNNVLLKYMNILNNKPKSVKCNCLRVSRIAHELNLKFHIHHLSAVYMCITMYWHCYGCCQAILISTQLLPINGNEHIGILDVMKPMT